MRRARRLAPALLGVLAGCAQQSEPARDPGVIHLAGMLRTPDGTVVPATRRTFASVGRETVEISSGGELVARIRVPRGATLHLAAASVGVPGETTAEVLLRRGGREHHLWRGDLEKRERWVTTRIDLAEHAGREAELVLRATAPAEAVVVWGSPVVAGEGASEGRRDVLLHTIDTLRADRLEPYGFPERSAPAIAALARRGVLFAECLSTSSWTRPGTASILTSLSPPVHGAIDEDLRLADDIVTLSDVLREGGWYTVAFQTNVNAGRAAGLDQGFDLVLEMNALVAHARRNRDAWTGTSRTSTGSASGTSELVAFLLSDLLHGWEDLPLFLYLHVNDPHAPYDPRGPFDRLPGMAREGAPPRVNKPLAHYGGDVRWADWFLRVILRMLREADRLDRTVVAVVADHGEEFRDHGRMGHGINAYQETLRVPLVVCAPWAIPAGLVRRDRVSVLDVMPTILELADVPPPPGLEGRSLLGESESGGDPFADEPDFAHLVTLRIRLDDEAMQDPAVIGDLVVLRGPWKCIVSDYGTRRRGGVQLFDLREDPGELRDVSAENPQVAAALEAEARQWWATKTEGRQREQTGELEPEFVEQLRALGYVE